MAGAQLHRLARTRRARGSKLPAVLVAVLLLPANTPGTSGTAVAAAAAAAAATSGDKLRIRTRHIRLAEPALHQLQIRIRHLGLAEPALWHFGAINMRGGWSGAWVVAYPSQCSDLQSVDQERLQAVHRAPCQQRLH